MSRPAATSSSYQAPAGPGTAPVSRARATIVAVALALGSAAVAAVLLWRPGPERNDLGYAAIAPVRDGAWTGGLVDSIGGATAAVALAIAVCLLVTGRGAGWANVGAVLTALGGALFASGVFAYAVLGWYATATEAIPAESGTALLSYFEDNPAHVLGPQITGLLAFTLGLLLLTIALWRSRSVPRWLPAVMAVLALAQFVSPASRILDVLQAALMGTFVAVAWFLRGATAPGAPRQARGNR